MTEKKLIEKLRKQYSENPPEGMTQQDVLHMSDKDLLDMDYFLTEEDDDGFWRRRLLYLLTKNVQFVCRSWRALSIQGCSARSNFLFDKKSTQMMGT